MGKTLTNLSVILGLITIAFGGFYLYTQYGTSSLGTSANSQNMLNETKIFIERGEILQKTTLDIGFFEDERFRSLRSYTTPINEYPIGRPDPFSSTNPNTVVEDNS